MTQGIHYKLKKFKLIKKYKSGITLLKLKYFSDSRGEFIKLFSTDDLKKVFKNKICQINFVKNKKIGIFRGFHYQTGKFSEYKLITCIKGKIEVTVIQCNSKSKNYLKKFRFLLSQKNNYVLVIPKNFANGYLVLEKNTEVIYLSDKKYQPKYEKIINPYDPKLNIKWRLKKLILSKKDKFSKFL